MMKLCDQHQLKLQQALKARGMYDFVCWTTEEAAKKLQDRFDHGLAPRNFDPLSQATLRLFIKAQDIGLMDNTGETCPVCWSENDDWIDDAAEDMRMLSQTMVDAENV